MREGWRQRLFRLIFPWPSRKVRKARIAAARDAAAESQRKLAESEHLKKDLERILAQNHFAQVIVEGLIGGRDGGGRR